MSGTGGAVVGWRCAACGTSVDVATVHGFTCPRATARDRHHVLHPVTAPGPLTAPALDDTNPFVTFGPRMAWWSFAAAHGMPESARRALVEEVAAGFSPTPLRRHVLQLTPPPHRPRAVWVKDETGNVGGSHKARHLAGILLHLRAAEVLGVDPGGGTRPPLAIASCGNAAIAAATLAGRVGWPLRVFVPDWASPAVLGTIEALGGLITTCPRRTDDPPGDPAVLRFREAVAAGAIPFSVQGPENALCLDGGRTLGWEIAAALGAPGGPERLDRALVQVGGGALAAGTGWGLGPGFRLDTVQAVGGAPLARAWRGALAAGLDVGGTGALAARWDELMTPWDRPHSVADGILDDETYDWLGVLAVMAASGGRPLVVPDEAIERALAAAAGTGIPVSATGAAGLAGLLVDEGRAPEDEEVAVIFSGVAR